jgi:predicted nucleic acid-binding protein
MNLDAIEEASAVFIDANVFIYHFVGASAQCSTFLARCESRELRGATSALVLAEVCHRLMTIEAVERKLMAPSNVASKLATRPDLVRRLMTYESAIEAIPSMGIEVTAVTDTIVVQGLRIQRRYGLLTNDSMVIATMLRDGFRILATADRRLARVDGIETALPTDLGRARRTIVRDAAT